MWHELVQTPKEKRKGSRSRLSLSLKERNVEGQVIDENAVGNAVGKLCRFS